MKKLEQAIILATEAHAGQIRKQSGIPYITHPLAVMGILVHHGVTDEDVLAAAVLHDVVEDCEGYGFSVLALKFGANIASMVDRLTKYKPEETEEDYNTKLGYSNADVQLVKLADILHNTTTKTDKKYYDKKRTQIKHLKLVTNHAIYKQLEKRFK
jgi:guanosine-3',5'-bis(diphosphate) 3'-pyrophosphohydrolase